MQQLQHGAQLRNGEYVIEYVLGQGGFGITYKATKTSTQQQVALKELFQRTWRRQYDGHHQQL